MVNGYDYMDMLLPILGGLAVLLIIIIMIMIIAAARDNKKKYLQEIRRLQKQLELTQRLLDETRARHEAEIKKLTSLSRPLRAVGDALEAGAIKLIHDEDGGRIITLQDGTLVCEHGHVVWPPQEDKEDEGGDGDG